MTKKTMKLVRDFLCSYTIVIMLDNNYKMIHANTTNQCVLKSLDDDDDGDDELLMQIRCHRLQV